MYAECTGPSFPTSGALGQGTWWWPGKKLEGESHYSVIIGDGSRTVRGIIIKMAGRIIAREREREREREKRFRSRRGIIARGLR